MAQLSAQTPAAPLSLVASSPGGISEQALYLPPGKQISEFLAAAAKKGLDAVDAVQMSLERGLALVDASELGWDVEGARATLNRSAARARPRREIGEAQAERVRRLKAARSLPPPSASTGLVVEVPERIRTRLGGLTPSCLRAEVVAESIAWEVAACLQGRTIGEWALWTLCRSQSKA